MSPPLPANETRRLQALHATALLDTPPEAAFDDLTRLAAQLCSAPFACLSLIDENRQWFKAVCGLAVELTPRSQSFCTHALSRTSPLVVPDATRDSRFANLPAVTSPPYIRAYAGAPLVLEADLVLGTLCVLDTQPRTFTEEQLENLQRLARQVVDQIQLRSKISALHQSEERYRAMFEQTAVGIAQVGLKGQWLHVNPRLCEMLGYSESELLALTVQDITVPEDMVRDLELTTQLVAGEINSFTLHQRYIHKLGHWVWTNLAVCLVKHDDGSPFCFGSIIEDITAQKRAELSLAAQEIRIRKLSESLPFIVWTARPDGQVDYANQHLLDYTGLSADDDPATRWQAMVHPDDLATCLTSWQAALQSSSSLEIEYRLRRHADGSYRWFRVQAAPIHDEQGNIVLWYGTALDLHENRQLQAEASHLVHRLTTTLESITDAFYTLDPDWRFTYINHEAERLLRRDRSGLLGRTVWDEFPGFDTTRIAAEYRRALQNNLTIALEEFYSPLETWFEIRAYPSAEGLAVYFRDVTERRRQLNAVRESEERFQLIARATNEAIWDWDIRTGRL